MQELGSGEVKVAANEVEKLKREKRRDKEGTMKWEKKRQWRFTTPRTSFSVFSLRACSKANRIFD